MAMDRKPEAAVLLLISLCAAILFSSCGILPISPVEATRGVLRARVGETGTDGPVYCRDVRLCGSDVLPAFYRARDFRPAWIDDGLTLTGATSFLAALSLVSEDGLDPKNYHLDAIKSLLSEIKAALGKRPRKARPEALVDLEMLLTDAFLLCGSQLVHGQVDPETFQSEWFIKGRIEDLAAALEKGLADKDIPGALDLLRPNHAVYRGLMKAFRTTRIAAAAGGWPAFPPGPKLKKGDWSLRVEALRNCLEARGDLTLSERIESAFFDAELEDGVKAFQRRHGLEPDGVVGAGTEAALNVPADVRLTQILANLERWRWITQDLGERYILINVADFRVGVFEGAREVLSMPAIVGSAYRRTPEFSGKLTYIEINPTWTVPPKLVREDILPKVRKDPGYLKEKGIRVFRDWSEGAPEIDAEAVDWSQFRDDALSFKFRQDPGPRNSLGRIKFIFPNKFDVYLHDTPDRGLFARAARDLSSGCIRLEKPMDLAEYILRDDPNWSREKILAALADSTTRVIPLRKPIGVHLLYWTAWLADDGRVQFRGDVYQRDAALSEALRQNASTSAE
jgi:murein L,D-transpeptidase YcbB/YkuD